MNNVTVELVTLDLRPIDPSLLCAECVSMLQQNIVSACTSGSYSQSTQFDTDENLSLSESRSQKYADRSFLRVERKRVTGLLLSTFSAISSRSSSIILRQRCCCSRKKI